MPPQARRLEPGSWSIPATARCWQRGAGQAAADRQRDQADDGLRGAEEAERRSERLKAPPYQALRRRVAARAARGREDDASDLLYALILESANDAAVDASRPGWPGRVPRFVEQMNRQAAALGLTNTSLREPGRARRAAATTPAPPTSRSSRPSSCCDPAVRDGSPTRRHGDLRSGDVPRRIDEPQHAARQRPHASTASRPATRSGPATCWSGRRRAMAPGWSRPCSAPAARRRATPRPRSSSTTASLSTRASQPVKAGRGARRPRARLSRRDACALVAKRGVEVSAREGQPVETEVEAPDEVSGAIERGRGAGQRRRSPSTAESPTAVPLVAAESVEAATLTDKVISTLADPVILMPARPVRDSCRTAAGLPQEAPLRRRGSARGERQRQRPGPVVRARVSEGAAPEAGPEHPREDT